MSVQISLVVWGDRDDHPVVDERIEAATVPELRTKFWQAIRRSARRTFNRHHSPPLTETLNDDELMMRQMEFLFACGVDIASQPTPPGAGATAAPSKPGRAPSESAPL